MKKLAIWIVINFIAQTLGLSFVMLVMAPDHILNFIPFLALQSVFTTSASMWVLYAWMKVDDVYFITKDTVINISKE